MATTLTLRLRAEERQDLNALAEATGRDVSSLATLAILYVLPDLVYPAGSARLVEASRGAAGTPTALTFGEDILVRVQEASTIVKVHTGATLKRGSLIRGALRLWLASASELDALAARLGVMRPVAVAS